MRLDIGHIVSSDSEPIPDAGAARLRRSIELAFARGMREIAGAKSGRALREASAAYAAGNLKGTLRILDCAWRYDAKNASTLGPIYGRVLYQGGELDAALTILRHGLTTAPEADAAALCALSLLQLRRPQEARAELETALGDFCVSADDLLAHAAAEVAGHATISAPGWVGRGAQLQVLGEVWAAPASGSLEIRPGKGAAFRHSLGAEPGAPHRAFSLRLPKSGVETRLQVLCDGQPLLGSGQPVSPDFGLDGRAAADEGWVRGWARVGWSPDAPPTLRLEDAAHRRVRIEAKRPLSARRWAFSQSLGAWGPGTGQLTLSARLPDGRWEPLPDSPILTESAIRLPKSRISKLSRWNSGERKSQTKAAHRARGIDVVIPVYRDAKESLACIDAAVATVKGIAAVIVVDDATTEPGLAAGLEARARKQRIRLLRNRVNLGFVASVNRAIALHESRDAVLLNSDTRVFGDWLHRLREAAYAREDIGTVTPFSNNASIGSYPQPLGGGLDVEAAARLDELAAATLARESSDIPVGVGSCLYLRRDCLREVGTLDAEIFGKGYGEETDFCLRARQRGWKHRLAANVYVFHAGGTSFGHRRAALLDRSQRLLNLRHPGYDRFIASFLKQDPLRLLRRRLDEVRLSQSAKPCVLLVTLALPGGVNRYVTERTQQLRKWGVQSLVLRPAEVGNPKRCELWSDGVELPNLQYDIPRDLAALSDILEKIDLKGVEIQHFLGLDARVIEVVRKLSVPYDVMVHDYAWICPRVTLIDGQGRYCGEPAVAVCERCVKRHGSSLEETITVKALRVRSADWLKGARRVLAPSSDAAGRLGRHFGELPVIVQPHSRALSAVPRQIAPLEGRPLRVGLLGAIGPHKGYGVLLECARNARARKLPIEFTVIGFTSNDAPLLATGRVFVTGRYEESEVPHLLQREQPDLGWLPSVWPETWCYALDHLLRTGLPLAAFDIGALTERLRSVAGAVLMPLGLAPARINDRLLQLARQLQVSENIF